MGRPNHALSCPYPEGCDCWVSEYDIGHKDARLECIKRLEAHYKTIADGGKAAGVRIAIDVIKRIGE